MTETSVNTGFYRTVTVIKNEGGTFLKVANSTSSQYEQAYLPRKSKTAEQIALALLDLPEVTEDGEFLKADDVFRRLGYYTSKAVLSSAKSLLAIGLELQKREQAAIAEAEAKIVAEEAAKAKAEEDELNQLRADVIHEHKDAFGYTFFPPYTSLCVSERRLIDALVELIQADRKRQAEKEAPGIEEKFVL